MKKFYSLILLILMNFFLFNIVEASFYENNLKFLSLEKLFFKKQKYIVFLIFFFPSIYFFKEKKFLTFGIFFLFQIFAIIYWQSLILWLQELAGDSLSEVNTLNIYFIFSWIGSIFNYLKPVLDYESFLKFYFFVF